MNKVRETDSDEAIPVLPDDVPVAMPELPGRLVVNTMEQFRAVSDPMRSRIIGIIQQQPATAKQIAARLKASPGAIGHHLHVLEEAGLVQVVARRFVRGTVANYYTRTARLFVFDFPEEVTGGVSLNMRHVEQARDELAASLASTADDPCLGDSFLHPRLSRERAERLKERLDALVEDVLSEPPDPEGEVYSLYMLLFKSPDYLQVKPPGDSA
jgi:DNA-binding transcriptional ArsR family regulator